MTEVLPPPGDDLGASGTSTAPAGHPLASPPSPNGSTERSAGDADTLLTVPPNTVPVAPASSPTGATPIRAGDIVLAWRLMLTLAWCAAFFAYAAVWQASVQIGIGTWWLGPRSEPTPPTVRIIPFAIVLLVIALVGFNVRRPIVVSLLGSVALVLFALPDLTRSVGLAVAELSIPIALGAVSLAALTGRYRRVDAPEPIAPAPVPPPPTVDPPEVDDPTSVTAP